jgi:phage shock protein A
MGLFDKLAGLVGAGAQKVEDKIDEKFGVELHEENLRSARKKLDKATQALDTAEARANVQAKELVTYHEEVGKYEGKLGDFKAKYENAVAQGDTEGAEKYKNLGFKIKGEIDSLKKKYEPQIEAHEMTMADIDENRQMIEESKAEIAEEEAQIDNYRATQQMLEVHRTQQKLNEDIQGASVGASGAVSKLKKQQEVEKEKMRLQRKRKQASSKTLDDEIAEAEKEDGGMPW